MNLTPRARRVALAPLLLALLPCGGCVITNRLWSGAGASEVGMPAVAGLVLGPRAGSRAVVVSYEVLEAREKWYYVQVPLDERLEPPDAFRFTGDARDAQAVGAERRDVAAAKLPLRRWPPKPPRGGRFIAVNEPGGLRAHTAARLSTTGVAIIPYWPPTDRGGYPVPETRPDGTAEGTAHGAANGEDFPPPAKVLLLPATQHRPSVDRTFDVVGAVLLTPFTLAADAVVTPVLFAILVSGQGFDEVPPPRAGSATPRARAPATAPTRPAAPSTGPA
jgi:hypothetical protein